MGTDPLTEFGASFRDRFRLVRELGRGGMGVVLLAEDRKHGRRVELKLLRPELSESLGRERFLREIRISAQLHHPIILTLHDSGEAAGYLYYVMPYVEGESLRDRIARERQLPIEEALRITRELADALEYAHGRGVVHRDIKPENILLVAGHPVIADFGVARALDEAGGGGLTETGLSIRTPVYMSPEQATANGPVDARSDVYAWRGGTAALAPLRPADRGAGGGMVPEPLAGRAVAGLLGRRPRRRPRHLPA